MVFLQNMTNIFLLFLLLFLKPAFSQCPTLASRHCLVDCTNAKVYHIACENIRGVELNKDLEVYIIDTQPILLSLWNSPMEQLTSKILASMSNQMISLELDNWINLKSFPELNGMDTLKHLTIMNSPRLTDMPLEMLPEDLETLALYRVGICELINDIDEVSQLPALNEFVFDQGTLSYVQPNYFKVFPNLTTIKIRGTTFDMEEFSQEMINTVKPLKKLHIIGNDFSTIPERYKQKVFEGTTISVSLEIDGEMDYSNNHLPLSRNAVVNFSGIRNCRKLSLRDNRFDEFIMTGRMFQNFTYLQELDLSHTFILKAAASFSGLPRLRQLRIAGNEFEELTISNIFEKSESTNLEILDLSDNKLTYLPKGMKPIAGNLRVLSLAGNRLDLEAIGDIARYVQHAHSETTLFSVFPNLQTLDLSRNGLTTFNGTLFERVRRLTTLNLGCNHFRVIRKEYFIGLPQSLKLLNLTACYNQTKIKTTIELDAFSTLPTNLQTLILAQSQYNNGVLDVFAQAFINKLQELDLSYNLITKFPTNSSVLAPLLPLKILKLRANKLQSIGPNRLAPLMLLEQLDLSRNFIMSIGADDFRGLNNLQVLTIAGNNIIDIEAGAFDPLLQLEKLYYGDNMFTDFGKIFPPTSKAGRNLIHLGLQELAIDCIPSKLFLQLPKLKWLYLNSSRAVSLGTGSFRKMGSLLKSEPFRLFAFRKPNLFDIGCTAYDSFEDTYSSSTKFVITDRASQVIQHMLIQFPTCHMDAPRNITFYTEDILCKDKERVTT